MPDNREADVSNKLSSRFCDLCFTPISPIEHEDNPDFYAYFRMSYPINFLYDVIVTHNRGLESPLEKMFKFYGWLTIIATTAIIWITFTVIYLSNSQNSSKLSFAVFECLRILLSNSIYTRMNTAKIRIFFSVIFLYFLIIQATFSGHLAAFLTKPVYKKNVETLEDLKDPRYTKIYARKGTESYFDDPVPFNKTQFDINADCVKYISDKSVACVDYKNYLEYLIPDHNLYTPKKNLMSIYSLLMMRGNWPLKDRVNNLVMSLHHSGIKDLWDRMDRRNLNKVLRKFQDNAENYNRPIEIGDVMFAFDLLGVGLFFAIICFIVECII
ncbi:GSCOCG00006965001-RA-CDS, partial [Cotesia congregata]